MDAVCKLGIAGSYAPIILKQCLFHLIKHPELAPNTIKMHQMVLSWEKDLEL